MKVKFTVEIAEILIINEWFFKLYSLLQVPSFKLALNMF